MSTFPLTSLSRKHAPVQMGEPALLAVTQVQFSDCYLLDTLFHRVLHAGKEQQTLCALLLTTQKGKYCDHNARLTPLNSNVSDIV